MILKGSTNRFSDPLPYNLLKQTERVGNRKASLIIIDGGVGSGKTHSGVNIGDWLNEQLTGMLLNLNIQYGMGGDDFEKKITLCIDSGKKIIIYDEAGDFNRRGAITKFNQRLNRIFETYRTFEIIVIMILPTVAVLDNQIFINKIPRMLINCHNKVNNKYTRFRAYSLNRMFWIKHYFSKLVVKPQAYLIEKPNFRGLIRPLSPERAREVDELSQKGKRKILKDKQSGEYDKHELAKEFNVSPKTVSVYLYQQKIKPLRKVNNKNLYGQDAYNYFANRPKFKNEGL